jgi:hypothetical protein
LQGTILKNASTEKSNSRFLFRELEYSKQSLTAHLLSGGGVTWKLPLTKLLLVIEVDEIEVDEQPDGAAQGIRAVGTDLTLT